MLPKEDKKEPYSLGFDVAECIDFRDVFNCALEPQLVLNLDGEILIANQSAATYFGINTNNLVNNSFEILLDQAGVEMLGDVLAKISDTKNTLVEFEFATLNETCISGDVFFQLLEVKDFKLVFCKIYDRQIERFLSRQIEEAELYYRGAERLANLGSWVYYPKANTIKWTDEVFEIFGLPISDNAPNFEQFVSFIHPDDVQKFLVVVQNAMERGEGYIIKHRIIRPDGALRWIQGRGDVFFDENNDLEKIFGTVQDITEEEENREAVRKSQQRIRFYMESSPLGYVEFDSNSNIIEWNTAAEDIFGYTKDEVLQQIPPIFTDESTDIRQTFFIGHDDGGHVIEENRKKTGDSVMCEWFYTTLIGEDGTIEGVSALVLDISQRMRDEEKLREYARKLEQEKDRAESAARAKSLFLANMSHEIRTPMNGVIGMASLLLGTNLDDEQKDFVETIVQSGDSLVSIINDILDFSKIEANKLDLERRPFSVRKVIETTLDLLSAKAADKGLELLYYIEPDTVNNVYGDPTRLQQILLNLLGNAVKFTEQGEVEVFLKSNILSETSVELVFSVADTGIGIPRDKLDRLFKAFSQVDASTSRKYGGTGLGLSISAKLCHIMGGEIGVESEYGRGAVFTFSIIADIDKYGTNPFSPFEEKIRVLVGHSNQKSQKMLEHMIEQMNGIPEMVSSCSEIIDRIRNGDSPDVVIIEDSLKDGSATMVAEVLKIMPLDGPPLVKLCKLTDRVDDSLFQGRLNKPVHIGSLYNIIQKLTVLQE